MGWPGSINVRSSQVMPSSNITLSEHFAITLFGIRATDFAKISIAPSFKQDQAWTRPKGGRELTVQPACQKSHATKTQISSHFWHPPSHP